VVTGFLVGDDDDLMVITDAGVLIRTQVDSVSTQGRSATGVRLMSLGGDTKVAAVARVLSSEDGSNDDDGDDEAGESTEDTTEDTTKDTTEG
jgi:DNA gyrase subunit A